MGNEWQIEFPHGPSPPCPPPVSLMISTLYFVLTLWKPDTENCGYNQRFSPPLSHLMEAVQDIS